jgi:hypothetical protein
MPDRIATIRLGGEAHQVAVADGSTANSSAGDAVGSIPDLMTAERASRGGRLLVSAVRMDPNRFNVTVATRIDIPVNGEPHQITLAAASSATASPGLLRIVVPANTTAEQIAGVGHLLADRARRDPNVVRG